MQKRYAVWGFSDWSDDDQWFFDSLSEAQAHYDKLVAELNEWPRGQCWRLAQVDNSGAVVLVLEKAQQGKEE